MVCPIIVKFVKNNEIEKDINHERDTTHNAIAQTVDLQKFVIVAERKIIYVTNVK
jgi:hypothetical protein